MKLTRFLLGIILISAYAHLAPALAAEKGGKGGGGGGGGTGGGGGGGGAPFADFVACAEIVYCPGATPVYLNRPSAPTCAR